MRSMRVGAMVACMLVAAAPASADVKAGVDAWQQGDYTRAIAEWRPAAAAGDADAQFNLGQAYKLGRGVPVDLPIAMEWFRKAATQGHQRASDNLGLLLFQQGRRDDAMPYIRKAADRGEPRAQYILGTAMFNGDLAPKDWVMAYALMTRAAAAGLEQATNSLTAMDKYIPSDQRQKGLAIAAKMAQDKGAEIAAAQPGPTPKPVPAPAREKPRPIASAPMPPSSAAQPTPKPAPVAPPAKPAAPERVASAPPKAKPAPSGDWRVQLGAFREEARAKSLWASVTAKLSGLESYQPYLVRGGDVTRLQAGPLRTEADASRLCGRLSAAGYDCLVKHK